MNYILAIDEGTTGTTALLMDTELNVVAEASEDFRQIFPKPGWVEHDLNDIWTSVQKTIQKVTASIDTQKIAAIGITNQRETTCFWDKKTGEILSNAIVWQDRRTADFCDLLKKKKLEKFFQKNTGLLLDPYFSGTKVSWAIKNWGNVQKAFKNKTLAVGTIDSFLLNKLSGGKIHATEPSNASRTLCFHLTRHRWDPELCKKLNLRPEIWPEVKPSTSKFGVTHGLSVLPDGIPITGILGDQQAALMGQACIHEGTAKCTYGTGAFLLLNTGSKPIMSSSRLLTTIAWALDENRYTYALEGSAFIAGAAVQWLRDGLKFIHDSAEIERLALSVDSSEGVVFVPSLTGLGAPHWDAHATGMLTGLTRGTTQAHVARAVLEGIAFQNSDILTAMQKDMKKSLKRLNVDGGAAANNLLMQFQSDILGVQLKRPKYLETTSLGAVFAAGLGAGLWKNLQEIEKTWKEDRIFNPVFTKEKRKQALISWNQAIKKVTYQNKNTI